jgi:glycosyltransferase involved in cell wall biosynthesis
MSCEKPTVATDVGGIPELILDGETGLLVPPQDSDAIAQAVLRLLSDRDLRHRMGIRGRERVEKFFTWDIHAEKLRRIYEKISVNHRS